MTREEKVASWKGEKVILLDDDESSKKLLGQPRKLWQITGCLNILSDKPTAEDEIPYTNFAKKTGVVEESVIRSDNKLKVTVALDGSGKKIEFCEIEYLGFLDEMEFAKNLTGKSFWTKKSVKLRNDCTSYSGNGETEPLPLLSKLTLTRAEWGFWTMTGAAIEPSRIPIIFYFKTDKGQDGCVVEKMSLLERFNVSPDLGLNKELQSPYTSFFYLNDPKELHSDWSDDIWTLIQKGKVAVGMSAEMAKMACQGEMKEEGFDVSSSTEELRTTYSCEGNSRFTIQNGKVIGDNTTSENQSAITNIEDIEKNLQRALANPSAVVVVKDTKDLYWAIPVSGVREVKGNTLTLNKGTRIAAGSGKGPAKSIAELLVSQRSSGGAYFVSKSEETSVTGQAGDTKEVTTITVKEFILSKI